MPRKPRAATDHGKAVAIAENARIHPPLSREKARYDRWLTTSDVTLLWEEVLTAPCPSCPWRVSTRTKQIPGGGLDHDRMRAAMADNPFTAKVMACHLSTDANPAACAGFMVRVGFDSIAVRFAAMQGLTNPRKFTDGGAELHPDVAAMLAAHPHRASVQP